MRQKKTALCKPFFSADVFAPAAEFCKFRNICNFWLRRQKTALCGLFFSADVFAAAAKRDKFRNIGGFGKALIQNRVAAMG